MMKFQISEKKLLMYSIREVKRKERGEHHGFQGMLLHVCEPSLLREDAPSFVSQ
jgi:hypothetical protein